MVLGRGRDEERCGFCFYYSIIAFAFGKLLVRGIKLFVRFRGLEGKCMEFNRFRVGNRVSKGELGRDEVRIR